MRYPRSFRRFWFFGASDVVLRFFESRYDASLSVDALLLECGFPFHGVAR